MSALDAIRDLFGRRRASERVAVTYAVRAANVLGMDATQLYRKQPHLRAVVSFLADNVADVPLKCYVREADDSRPRDTDSAFARLIERPSRGMTAFEYVRAVTSDLCLYEHALAVLLPDDDPRSASGWQLRHIPWSWVSADETLDGFEPSAFRVTNPYTGGSAVFDAADCVHYFDYDPEGGAMPPAGSGGTRIDALREVLAEQISAWNFRNAVWRNGGQVTQYLSRPASAARWDPDERARFAQSFKEKFAGPDGTNTGGTLLLEDGMELKSVAFNARESQFVEATRLTREDVSAIYHVNPSVIWHSDTQTYASARDNARALYAEALSPIFTMVQQRNNATLPRMLGLGPEHYCEFDMSKKLAASFEEQAGVLQSSAGGPWITRNEARARMNLPALPGADELIVPLNVTEGGLASPNDTDPTKARLSARPIGYVLDGVVYAMPQAGEKSAPAQDARVEAVGGDVAPFGEEEPVGLTKARPTIDPTKVAEHDVTDVLERFYERQATSIANRLAAMEREDALGGGTLEWWGKDRWATELGQDLAGALFGTSEDMAARAFRELRLDVALFDREGLSDVIRELCDTQADNIVQSTLERLTGDLRALEKWTADDVKACVVGSMQRTSRRYLSRNSRSLANSAANASVTTSVGKAVPKARKKWIATGVNTRSSHARMHGQTTDIDKPFSNGAMWPGDPVLGAAGTVNCRCRVEVIRDKHNSYDHGVGNAALFRRHATAVGEVEINSDQFGDKASEHMKEFGIDPTSGEGRNEYRRLALRFLQEFDEVLDGEWHGDGIYPAFFFRIGNDIMIVMKEGLEFVSMFPGGAVNNERIRRARHYL